MVLHAEDLPAHLRKQLGVAKRSTKKRDGVGEAAITSGHCVICGEMFTQYTAFVKHSKESGHGHWRLDLVV